MDIRYRRWIVMMNYVVCIQYSQRIKSIRVVDLVVGNMKHRIKIIVSWWVTSLLIDYYLTNLNVFMKHNRVMLLTLIEKCQNVKKTDLKHRVVDYVHRRKQRHQFVDLSSRTTWSTVLTTTSGGWMIDEVEAIASRALRNDIRWSVNEKSDDKNTYLLSCRVDCFRSFRRLDSNTFIGYYWHSRDLLSATMNTYRNMLLMLCAIIIQHEYTTITASDIVEQQQQHDVYDDAILPSIIEVKWSSFIVTNRMFALF